METKVCTHCGEELPISSFRPYYGRRSGTYRYCKKCERLLMRYKYLVGKGENISECDAEELAKLNKLFEYRRAAGLETPGHGSKVHKATATIVDELLAEFEANNDENV